MPLKRFLYVLAVAGCGISTSNPSDPGSTPDGDPPPIDGTSSLAVPDLQCAGAPDAGPAGELRHTRSSLITALGSPRHRGLDLVATPAVARQVLAGSISYTMADKALEDEDVELFACIDGDWAPVGDARTDDEGRFSLALEGDDRLAIGMRDLYVSVVGDRTGARFLAYVAPSGTRMVASDVDGTLTSSESTFIKTVLIGSESLAQPGAAAAFTLLAQRGYQPIYITARGQQFMESTRAWFAEQGFPRGPMILAPSFVTIPGGDTVDFKAGAMANVRSAGLVIAAGIGNRASDVAAYDRASLPPVRIFVGTTEFADELAPDLDAGRATGFGTYDELRTDHLSQLP